MICYRVTQPNVTVFFCCFNLSPNKRKKSVTKLACFQTVSMGAKLDIAFEPLQTRLELRLSSLLLMTVGLLSKVATLNHDTGNLLEITHD